MGIAGIEPHAAVPVSGGNPARDAATGDHASVLTVLKLATRAEHRAVEARLFPSAVSSVGAYRAFLTVMLGLHAGVEPRLAAFDGFAGLGVDLVGRQRSPLLRADLAALDGSVTVDRPGDVHAPDLPTFGHALGAFYVLEGSTLGGRVLQAEVCGRWGALPTSFLGGFGAQTGRQWHAARRALVQAVRQSPEPSAMMQEMVIGARTTFRALDMSLDQSGWSA